MMFLARSCPRKIAVAKLTQWRNASKNQKSYELFDWIAMIAHLAVRTRLIGFPTFDTFVEHSLVP